MSAQSATTLDEIKPYYESHGQAHCLKWASELSPSDAAQLLSQLKNIDLDDLDRIYTQAKSNFLLSREILRIFKDQREKEHSLQPFPKVCSLDTVNQKRKEWDEIGLKKIAEGKVGVLLLAGGQGTRLGTVDPKGMYDVGLPSKKSLYQLQAERLLKLHQLAANKFNQPVESVSIPWYIMGSEATGKTTREYFEKNNYFGLNPKNIFFFEQGMLPAITPEGKIIMESAARVSLAPDGNGGLYAALVKSGALEDMEKRGLEVIHQYCVDNVLVKIADPTFTGYCVQENADIGVKVVAKAYPEEPVGVVCLVDGKPGVMEYSELDEKHRNLKDENGKLVYGASHICMNLYSVAFLKKVAATRLKTLPYHIAKKKIPYADENGKRTDAKEVNGWKMEQFIFDIFDSAERMVVFEISREEEFSPLKNGPSATQDCPQTCRQMLSDLHKKWILSAEGSFENDAPEKLCEIAPALSYFGEGLESSVKGKKFSLPLHLQ